MILLGVIKQTCEECVGKSHFGVCESRPAEISQLIS